MSEGVQTHSHTQFWEPVYALYSDYATIHEIARTLTKLDHGYSLIEYRHYSGTTKFGVLVGQYDYEAITTAYTGQLYALHHKFNPNRSDRKGRIVIADDGISSHTLGYIDEISQSQYYGREHAWHVTGPHDNQHFWGIV